MHNECEQPLIAFLGDHGANPLTALCRVLTKPLMTRPALEDHIIQIKPQLGILAFGEEVGRIEDGAVGPEWADTPAAVPEEQHVFQEAVEPVVFFLLGTFAGERSLFYHSQVAGRRFCTTRTL